MGRAMLHLVIVFAEMERDFARERTLEAYQAEHGFHHRLLHRVHKRSEFGRVGPVVLFCEDEDGGYWAGIHGTPGSEWSASEYAVYG